MSKTIVFFGSGPVAAKSLRLLAEHCTIEAVVTKPRALHYKGSVPVIETAEELKLPYRTVRTRKEVDELFATHPFKSKAGVLIDFGIIVSQAVIDYFPLGIINSHFSLLPEWRGADPITFAVLSGQKNTGVSLMQLTAGMDEGPILSLGIQEISPGMTTPTLTERLILLSDALLQKQLEPFMSGDKQAGVPQATIALQFNLKSSYSRKLTKADGVLDWSKPAARLEREVRAYAGWPGSRTTLNAIELIVTQAQVIDQSGQLGTYAVNDKQLLVYCADKALALTRVKPLGKKEMPIEAFLAGYRNRL